MTILEVIAALGALDRHDRRLVVYASGVPYDVESIAVDLLTSEVRIETQRAYNEPVMDRAPCCEMPTR